MSGVSRHLGFALAGRAVPYPMRLTYEAARPWEVALDFPPQVAAGGVPVRWVLGRELLLAGVASPAGLGDVRVVPVGAYTAVGLRTDEGGSWLATATAGLLAFLDATRTLVPVGRESEHVDWDRVLARLRQG